MREINISGLVVGEYYLVSVGKDWSESSYRICKYESANSLVCDINGEDIDVFNEAQFIYRLPIINNYEKSTENYYEDPVFGLKPFDKPQNSINIIDALKWAISELEQLNDKTYQLPSVEEQISVIKESGLLTT